MEAEGCLFFADQGKIVYYRQDQKFSTGPRCHRLARHLKKCTDGKLERFHTENEKEVLEDRNSFMERLFISRHSGSKFLLQGKPGRGENGNTGTDAASIRIYLFSYTIKKSAANRSHSLRRILGNVEFCRTNFIDFS